MMQELLKQVKISIENKEKANKRQRDIFNKYGLDKKVDNLYPFELSGGMARKVLLSTALVSDCKVIIADEPTPGIHQAVLDKVLKQLRDFADSGISVILITHDIISAVKIADRISVFKDGKTIETAPSTSFIEGGESLKDEYSKRLWNSLPQNNFLEDR